MDVMFRQDATWKFIKSPGVLKVNNLGKYLEKTNNSINIPKYHLNPVASTQKSEYQNFYIFSKLAEQD